MIINFVNNLLQLALIDLDLRFIQGLSKLINSDVSSLVFVHAHEHVTQLLNLLEVCHFHKQIHGRLLQLGYAFVLTQSFQYAWVELILLAPNSKVATELLKPGIPQRLVCSDSFFWRHNEHSLNQRFCFIRDLFKLFMVEVELSVLYSLVNMIPILTLERKIARNHQIHEDP